MKRLLIIYHSQSGRTARLAQACLRGARRESAVDSEILLAREAGAEDLLRADGLLFGTPANFGYMSGALKDFFDRTYYPVEGKLPALPYGVFISCENDPAGALGSIERICKGYGFRPVAEPVVAYDKRISAQATTESEDLGHALAAGLDLGIF